MRGSLVPPSDTWSFVARVLAYREVHYAIIERAFVSKFALGVSVGEKSIRLVTALVECSPDGEYRPWGIKWYDGRIFPFA